ncbi:acyl carrier protein [Pseudobutyrivibrio sp.]|jgi:acyl carrier protein|uniref:acyl carrier protein n=1 Tax=Pseudobutyrivibrio sp. TaxID=2014367 RepID=UPI0025E98EA0|nr:phosphopantetheine-binding protein [Pseudobutyrivibrio sp.]
MNTSEQILGLIDKLSDVDVNTIKNDDELLSVIDSLTFIKLIVAIDEEFNLSIEDEDVDFDKLNSVNLLVKYVEDNSK